LGMGFGMALYTVIVQNALPTKIGQATSALTFFRQIAGTVALSAMGSVLTTAYVPAFHNALTPQVKEFASTILQQTHQDILKAFENPNVLLSPEVQAAMTQKFQQIPNGMLIYNQLLDAVKLGLSQGIHNIFIISVGILLVGLVGVFFLKELPLRGRGPTRKAKDGTKEEQIVEEEEVAINPSLMH
ncbi:MAG TPA: MFS transporter, partial [Ktedonobacteraceae bacterium]|nr:MFS transporter [Ktedonobacteraceae bacterium]